MLLQKPFHSLTILEKHFCKFIVIVCQVKELFGSGTACVVCPIKEIVYQGERHQIPTMEEGAPVTTMFYKQLTDIQVGIIVTMHLLCAISQG